MGRKYDFELRYLKNQLAHEGQWWLVLLDFSCSFIWGQLVLSPEFPFKYFWRPTPSSSPPPLPMRTTKVELVTFCGQFFAISKIKFFMIGKTDPFLSMVLIHRQQSATARQRTLLNLCHGNCQWGLTLVVQQKSQTAVEPNGRIKIISISTTHHKQLSRQ